MKQKTVVEIAPLLVDAVNLGLHVKMPASIMGIQQSFLLFNYNF